MRKRGRAATWRINWRFFAEVSRWGNAVEPQPLIPSPRCVGQVSRWGNAVEPQLSRCPDLTKRRLADGETRSSRNLMMVFHMALRG